MIIEIDVRDEISPLTKRILEHNAGFLRHVSKSLGWWYQKNAKLETATGAPAGETWPARVPYHIRKAIQNGHAAKSWYGRMRQAIGYQYVGKGTTVVGWTSNTAAMEGRMQEEGYSRKVTQAMRAKWAAIGFPLAKDKTEIVTPARPIFDPVSRKMRPQVAGYVEKKVQAYATENIVFGKKNRRKYVVYG